MPRAPSAHGIELKGNKVMDALKEREMQHPKAGLSLLKTFRGELCKDDTKFWVDRKEELKAMKKEKEIQMEEVEREAEGDLEGPVE
ncbi:hypothetical protein K469DRAFT_711580 [Zopfia rhizophila CBS 207.26]|uniref:Uncharacterized protein n=1 Tax=Zopfia rhizophila CBS 207.26 TaxID=1314779 RepID=A0A6A6DWX3_9PEZI|nr:hypothetical protein K469DRAFT_711580 [Zopfia rhizophila CBS 207.26]